MEYPLGTEVIESSNQLYEADCPFSGWINVICDGGTVQPWIKGRENGVAAVQRMHKARGRALSFQRFDTCGDDLDGHDHSRHPENQRNEHISGLSFEQIDNNLGSNYKC